MYNNLPDIISNLSACTTKTEAGVFVEGELKTMTGVDEESFKKIMEFLFSFVKKVKSFFQAINNPYFFKYRLPIWKILLKNYATVFRMPKAKGNGEISRFAFS